MIFIDIANKNAKSFNNAIFYANTAINFTLSNYVFNQKLCFIFFIKSADYYYKDVTFAFALILFASSLKAIFVSLSSDLQYGGHGKYVYFIYFFLFF